MHNDVDINYGVDFERALERLRHAAGKILRRYREAKHDNADVAEIARLRQAYLDAQREAEAPSPRDTAGIQAVLAKTGLGITGYLTQLLFDSFLQRRTRRLTQPFV